MWRKFEARRVHVAGWRDISDRVETGDIGCLESRVVHSLANSLNKEVQCSILRLFVSESIHVDHGQIILTTLIFPNSIIYLIESAIKAVKEFNCIHRQIHQAVMEFQEVSWHTLLLSPLIFLINQHP